MPIIKPEVQKVLRAAGLQKEVSTTRTVDENLDLAGLSNEAIAEALTRVALHSESDHIKLRALETALKVKGAMKEQAQQLPQFTIVIQNSEQSTKVQRSVGGVNPILIPRQSLKHTPVASLSDERPEELEEFEVEVELEESEESDNPYDYDDLVN